MAYSFRLKKTICFAVLSLLIPLNVFAEGGISIQGTRIIYPQNSRQESLSLRNSSSTDSFLVQSWVEDTEGRKSQDFIVTPPLYLSEPGNENILRLVRVDGELPQDRESLYYFVAKAIPSISDENHLEKNVIRIAAASRIKLFVRPAELTFPPDKAPSELSFRCSNGQLEINNPTPYYITMTDVKLGKKPVHGVMVKPRAKTLTGLQPCTGSHIIFSTINDYGAVTVPITVPVK